MVVGIALDPPSLAAIIAAIGSACAAILGGIALVIAASTRRDTRQINSAVNGKPHGAQSIQGQVDDLHEEIDDGAILPLLRKVARRLDVNGNGGS